MIQLEHLVKKFGDLTAVNDVSLTIGRGEFFAMLGPNAAGKTTTIKLLTGLIKPHSGRARICGFDVQTEPLEARRRLAYVPDFPFLYDKLTAWEFFRFTGQMFRLDAARIEKNAQELVARFHLAEFADRTLEGLSHGTRQRIAIVSALLHDPEVFVIDEPMVGLDPAAVKMVKDIFRSLAADGKTIFMSTHTLSVAENLCDRIGIIHRGAMIALGTMDELKVRADLREGDLEEVFIHPTEEGDGP